MATSALGQHSPPPLVTQGNGKPSKADWELDSPIGDFPDRKANESRTIFEHILQFIPFRAARRRKPRYSYNYHAAPTGDELDDERGPSLSRQRRQTCFSRWLRYLRKGLLLSPLIFLVSLGLLHILLALFGGKSLFWDVLDEPADDNWIAFEDTRKEQYKYPTDATRDIHPIPCHSHNDYWRKVPLWDAIHAGCTSVEADLWFYDGEDDLFVGHSSTSLSADRTFTKMYVDPLRRLLDSMNPTTDFGSEESNGVFDVDPSQTLVLLIDFKTDGHALYPRVVEQLEPLRQKNYLSYWDGEQFIPRAVTVVGTGNAPFDLINAEKSHRDLFFDAPLDKLWEEPPPPPTITTTTTPPNTPAPLPLNFRSAHPAQGSTGTASVSSPNDFNTTNSYYASVSFFASIGYPVTGHLTSHQMNLIRGQIRGAQRRGLKARYWETPSWPTSLRNRIWEILVREGADVLNVDDLKSARALDWRDGVGHAWMDAR